MIDEHFSLIVIDSATGACSLSSLVPWLTARVCALSFAALFRVDFMGRGQLADRQQK
jgi:hypothetical protein